MKLIFKVWKVEKVNGIKVHQDGFKPINSLKRRSAVTSVRYRLMLTCWSN